MAAAKQEFARKGYIGTSLRTITARAGLTTGAFYNNFQDKKEIYLVILAELSFTLQNIMEEAIQEFLDARRTQPKDTPTIELLRVPVARVFHEGIEQRELFEILCRDGLAREAEFGLYYRKILEDFTRAMNKGLEAFVESGMSRPYRTGGLARVSVILFATMVMYASYERVDDLDEWIDTMAAMIHGGAKQLSAWRSILKDKRNVLAGLEQA